MRQTYLRIKFAAWRHQGEQYRVFGEIRARAQSDERGTAANPDRGVSQPADNHPRRADRSVPPHHQQPEQSHGLQSDAP